MVVIAGFRIAVSEMRLVRGREWKGRSEGRALLVTSSVCLQCYLCPLEIHSVLSDFSC